MLERSTNGLAALNAQIESATASLRESIARLEIIKITATAIHGDAARERQALTDALAHRDELGDPDRIISIKEAAKLRGVSVDTLRRTDRDKFIQLSDSRLGMRVKDALMLGKS
jgi:hypothetical protein